MYLPTHKFWERDPRPNDWDFGALNFISNSEAIDPCVSSTNQPPIEAETSATSPVASAYSEKNGNTSKLSTSHALNAPAPAWSPPASCLLDDPKKLAKFLECASPEAMPSSPEVNSFAPSVTIPKMAASPTAPRMSFADALYKKTKRGGTHMLANKPTPPCFTAATSSIADPVLSSQPQRGEHAMASRGRRGGALAREDEPRREERAEHQASAPQGPILPPSPHMRADVWWASLLRTRFEDGAIGVAWDEFVRLFRAKFIPEHI
ncbi:hypothetical protein Taro_019187 [Colocasia esculenta]|uniref:Uncharacterized protein n=1 Tax=Colocasia esculenta TaxID=4460 RepID=A0A843V1F0_COLES|nr:hypothetical protein [Colocasia esculenta]